MKRDTEEFIELLTGAQSSVFGYIMSLVHDPTKAQDVLQETNITLWRKAEDFEMGTNFTAWACRTAYFHVLNYRRKASGNSWYSKTTCSTTLPNARKNAPKKPTPGSLLCEAASKSFLKSSELLSSIATAPAPLSRALPLTPESRRVPSLNRSTEFAPPCSSAWKKISPGGDRMKQEERLNRVTELTSKLIDHLATPEEQQELNSFSRAIRMPANGISMSPRLMRR